MVDILVVSQSCLTAINREPYRELARRGWQVEIVCPEKHDTADFSRRADPRGEEDPPIHFLPLLGTHPRLWTFAHIRNLVDRIGPKIVILDCDAGSRLTVQLGRVQRRHGGRLVCISCDNMDRTFSSELRRGPKAILRLSVTKTLSSLARKYVDHVFALSEDIVKVIKTRGLGDRVTKMPLGFDPCVFFPDADARQQVRKELGLTGTVVGYFGRMTPTKGLDLLLHSLHELKDRPWQLLLDDFAAYKDPYVEEIRLLIRRLELGDRTIRFDAGHADIARYMNAVDIVVLASITTSDSKEQYGRVVPEAMACGRCVIVSDSGALPELVGDAGIVVPERNVERLAMELDRALEDPEHRADLGRRARERALSKFSIVQQANRMEQVFERWTVPASGLNAESRNQLYCSGGS